MKIAIVYCSRHHGNTKKLLDAIAAAHTVSLVDVTQAQGADLSDCDMVGFASGIYYGRFHKSVLRFAEEHLPEGKPVFFLYTCGAEKEGYTKAIEAAVRKKSAQVRGAFGCLGFDSFGPFKLIGGIAKGHPDEKDCAAAVRFFEGLTQA